MFRIRLASAHWLLALAGALALAPGVLLGAEPTVTVWLMPSEPADEQPSLPGMSFDQQIEEFCQQYPHVTILNAVDPYLRAQLIAWSPEFAQAAWPMLKGQKRTLSALERFAENQHVRVRFRLESWANAFGDIRAAKSPPDVAQVGSTWISNLAAGGKLKPGPPDGLRWRGTPELQRASLLYATDLRLIFYWRRPPGSDLSGPVFDPTSDNWESFLGSLSQYVERTGSKPMALPIGVTQNLLHDYATLIWAGGGDLLHGTTLRTYADLSSDSAMVVPLMLTRNAVVTREGQPYRLLAFPEMDHEEATRHFMAGDYVAVIEPVAFIRRWFDDYMHRDPKPLTPQTRLDREREFWDRAGIAAPPVIFKGGSDLIVLNSTEVPEAAFSLARFLVQDTEFTELIGSIGWMPAQLTDYGLGALKVSLWPCDGLPKACRLPSDRLMNFDRTVRQATEKGREYPQYADWPIAFESRPALDQFQNLWRAIGEGDEKGVGAAAIAAQLGINRKIDRWTQWKEIARRWGFALLVGSIPLVWWELHRRKRIARAHEERAKAESGRAEAEKQRAEAEAAKTKALMKLAEGEHEKSLALARAAEDQRNRAEALEREASAERAKTEAVEKVRKLGGAACAALLVLDTVHDMLKHYKTKDARPLDTRKAAIVDALLEGWRRGQEEQFWQELHLKPIIWRSVLLAIRSVREPGLFREWERDGKRDVEAFLKERQYIRSHSDSADGPPLYIDVKCPSDISISTPFAFEQILVCLIQNAIQPPPTIEEDDEEDSEVARLSRPDSAVIITHCNSALGASISVSNMPKKLSGELLTAINEGFERRLPDLLKGPPEHRPGVGLVHAYFMAKQFYGGLGASTSSEGSVFTLRLPN